MLKLGPSCVTLIRCRARVLSKLQLNLNTLNLHGLLRFIVLCLLFPNERVEAQ